MCLFEKNAYHFIDKDGFFNLQSPIGFLAETDVVQNIGYCKDGTCCLPSSFLETGTIIRRIQMDVSFEMYFREDTRFGKPVSFSSKQVGPSMHELVFPGGFPNFATGLTTKKLRTSKEPSFVKVVGEHHLHEQLNTLFDAATSCFMQIPNSTDKLIICKGLARGVHGDIPVEEIASIKDFDRDILRRIQKSKRFNQRSLKDWDVAIGPDTAPVWTKIEQSDAEVEQSDAEVEQTVAKVEQTGAKVEQSDAEIEQTDAEV